MIVIGLVVLGKFVVLPLANIVFGHQRQLAGIDQGTSSDTDRKKIEKLESEIQELKDRLNEQAILIDDRRQLAPQSDEVQSRLSN